MGFHGHGHSMLEDGPVAYDSELVRRLMKYVVPHWRYILLASIMTLGVAGSNLAGPYLLKVAIDRYIATGNLWGLNGVAALYILTHLVNWVCSYGQTYYMSWVGQNTLYSLRRDLFSHLQRLGFKFYDSRPAGVIMSRVTNDVQAIQELISGGLVHMISDVIVLGGIVTIMLLMNTRLALVSFLVLPFLTYTAIVFRNRVRRAYRDVRVKIANVNATLQESISGVRVAQSFVREDLNAQRFDQTNLENLQANMRAASLFSVFMPLVDCIGAAGISLILWYGGRQVMAGTLTVGVVVAFISYLERFYRPLQDLGQIYNTMQSAMAACEKIFAIMDTEPEITDRPGAVDPGSLKGHVRFENVTFGYDPDRPVLHDINLEALPGERVALVGPTGAGKTSIINLLARFYDPQRGRIVVDGHDLRDLKVECLRKQIGIVLQDTFLFSGTVKDNIKYGKLDATDEEVIAAAKAVGAHEFIEKMPQGYDTPVGERGAMLSIGQRQLISFARALLRDPRILILDEATSSVDAYTEVLIQRALEKLLEGRTSFIIAHRLSTVRNADKILVIDQGRIVERGTHAELLARGGLYAQLYEMQFRYQEVAGN